MPISSTPMLIFVFLLTLVLAVPPAAGQSARKGGSTPCVRPTTAPPDTTCFLGSGCRDPLFNNGSGYAIYPNTNALKSVMTLPDGNIIGVGEGSRSADSPTGRDLLVMRFNPDGSLDDTFGEVNVSNPLLRLGYLYIAVTNGSEFIQAGALQADGRILAAGWSTGMWYVIRMLPDGSLDPSFSGDGITSVASSEGLSAMAVQPDGKIVVGAGPNFNITRLLTDGSFDTTFGNGGSVAHNASLRNGGSRIWSIAFQRVAATPAEDRIVIGGWSSATNGGSSSFALMRLRSNGTADSTFGTGGKVSTSFFGLGDQVRALAIDPSNKIVAAGIARINSCTLTDFGIARYNENGQLDTSFGTQGKASLDLFNEENSVYALTVLPDGSAIIGGNARVMPADPVNRRYYLTLVKYDAAGNPDPAFGPGTSGPGVVTTMTSSPMSSFIFSLHRQNDGMILAAGVAQSNPVVARYIP